MGPFKEHRASTVLSSTRGRAYPLPSPTPASSLRHPPDYDVPDNASQLSHVPLPTFTVADPQSLFSLSRMARSSPSPAPSKRPKVLNKMGTIGKKVVHEVLGGQGNNPASRREIIPVSRCYICEISIQTGALRETRKPRIRKTVVSTIV